MADWHLTELDNALTAAGWRVLARHAGDNYKVSGTWEIQRSTRQAPLFIDFDGLDDMQCLPLSQSYACRLRGGHSLYFGKQSEHWQHQLGQFVAALNETKHTE